MKGLSTANKKFIIKDLPHLLKETYINWNKDNPWRLSAVVAYYAVLALPGLLVILINVVGAIWGEDIVRGYFSDEISNVLGHDAAESIQNIVSNAEASDKSIISTIIGIGTLIFGATGLFYQLQLSLNQVWEIRIDPKAGMLKLLVDRARGFAFVLVIGFLLLVSFVVTAAIGLLNNFIEKMLPDFLTYLAYAINMILSFGIITVLFALIFKYLPDAKIKWKTVWVGAVITSFLFTIGKFLLGLYFGHANPGSTYGAASSIVLVLLWVSYSCLILFFGAEFTWIFAKHYGKDILPSSHAILIKEEQVILQKGSDTESPEKK